MPSRATARSSQRRLQPAAQRTRTQRVSERALEPAAIKPMVGLQVPNGRLHRLAQLQPAPLLLAQALVPSPVNDLHAWVVGIDSFAPKPQVSHNLLYGDIQVLR